MTRLARAMGWFLLSAVPALALEPSSGNQFAHLDSRAIYYPSRTFAKLTTPSWFGEPGVKAVVILSIDDMRDPDKYEAYFRPILDRLAELEDGRSPLSIMTNRVDPDHPLLARWLGEGLSIETHTRTHPCPLLAKQDFDRAADDYLSCVDQIGRIPNNRPVAFRMPCCDSMNSVSPRFFWEIFNRRTADGRYLTIDSSVFLLLTAADKELTNPRWVTDASGTHRFRRYVQFKNFVNYIEDYPYPYVIGNRIWEFPCIVPSDWEGQNIHGKNSTTTLEDMKNALAAVVAKQGVFTLVFHPHGWIRADQVVDLINFANDSFGKAVRFASFRDVQERIDRHLLGGWPLKSARLDDNGVRLLDLNADGHLDVVVGHPSRQETRVWNGKRWIMSASPLRIVDRQGRDQGVKFVRIQPNGLASAVVHNEDASGVFHFDGTRWGGKQALADVVEPRVAPTLRTARAGQDRGVRARDIDGDGYTDLIVNNESQNFVLRWSTEARRWQRAAFALPAPGLIVDEAGVDRGLRFVDLNGDGRLDVVSSNDAGYFVRLFTDERGGWSTVVTEGPAGSDDALPLIVRNGTQNGAWFRDGAMFLQNEHTGDNPGQIIRRPLLPE